DGTAVSLHDTATISGHELALLSISDGIFRVSGSIPNIPLLIMNGPITHPIGIGFSCWSPGTSKLRRLLTISRLLRGESITQFAPLPSSPSRREDSRA